MIFVYIDLYLPIFTHSSRKHDGATHHFQVEDGAKEPMGKRKRPFQIEDIHDICLHLHIFTHNFRKHDGATKPFSNRRYCQTTDGEAEKTISNRRYS